MLIFLFLLEFFVIIKDILPILQCFVIVHSVSSVCIVSCLLTKITPTFLN